MRLDELKPTDDVHLKIEESEVTIPAESKYPAKYTDAAVLKMVVQDHARGEAWLQERQYPLYWRESDVLYQSPRAIGYFEGTAVTRANVSRFTVAKQVNSLAPAIQQAIFSDPTPFAIRPRPAVDQNTARAWTELLKALLDQCDFKSELTTGIESMVLNGTMMFRWGWETTTEMRTHYRRKAAPSQVKMPLQPQPLEVHTEDSDEFVAVDEEVTRNRPFFEQVQLGSVKVDPKWNKANQLWKANWLTFEDYVTIEDLRQLRNNPLYDIPSDEVLKDIIMGTDKEVTASADQIEQDISSEGNATHHAELPDVQTSIDPLEHPLQIIERWTPTRVYVVLQGKVVIRKDDDHGLPAIPFLSSNFWNIQNSGYGLGVGRIIGSDQRIEQGVTNAALDMVSFAVQPGYVSSRGANAPTDGIRNRLGNITPVDGPVEQAFRLIEQPKVPQEVWTTLQASKAASESATGADTAMVQGVMPGRGSSVGRTAEGAGGMRAAATMRIQAPVDRVIDGVVLPFIDYMYEMVRERMPMSEIRAILSDQMADDLSVDFNRFMSAKLVFDALAGTRLQAQAQAAQSLPFLLQVFQAPALVSQLNNIGMKVDVGELVQMVMDVSGWKNSRNLVVKMTDQELQAHQAATNQPEGKTAGELAKIAAKGDQDRQTQDQKDQANLATKLAVVAAEGKGGTDAKPAQDPLSRATDYVSREQDENTLKGSAYFNDNVPIG